MGGIASVVVPVIAAVAGSMMSGGGRRQQQSQPQYTAPDPEPLPVHEAEVEAESKAVRDAERRKIAQNRGMAGTLLTSPLGSGAGNSNSILGRYGQ